MILNKPRTIYFSPMFICNLTQTTDFYYVVENVTFIQVTEKIWKYDKYNIFNIWFVKYFHFR